MFEQLQNRLESVVKTLKGHGKITDSNVSEASREIRRALLEADVNFKVARDFIKRVEEKAKGDKVLRSISPGQQFIKILNDELTDFLGGDSVEIDFSKKRTDYNSYGRFARFWKNHYFCKTCSLFEK